LKKSPDTVLVIINSINALQPLQGKEGDKEKVKKEEEWEQEEKGGYSLWQKSFYSPIYLLRRIAAKYNIAVVLINESETVSECYYEQTQIPVVGNTLSHISTYRISFKNHDSCKVARIIHSPCYPEGEAQFTIEGEGITDVHK
jgi:RecA/RadA recombinase